MQRPLLVSDVPPLREKHLDLRRVKPGKEGFVRVCSTKVFGYHSHWFRGHSHPCYGEECMCPAPMNQTDREWHGVLHIVQSNPRKEMFLEITDLCVQSLLDQVPDRKNLRGLRVWFGRSGESMKGRIICRVDGVAQIDRDLPAECDPRKTLDVIWASNSPMDLRAFAG